MSLKEIQIIDYQSEYRQYFHDLNIEWLETYFYVEDYDREVLSKPEIYILDKNGIIFFAKKGEDVVGTVALMPMKEENVFELTKMAVNPNVRGLGIGKKLMQHAIDFAQDKNWKALVLYSSRKLENAIHIYRKYGFREVDVEVPAPYNRCDIKMRLNLQ